MDKQSPAEQVPKLIWQVSQQMNNNLVRTEEQVPPQETDQPEPPLAVGIVIKKVTSREIQSVQVLSQAPQQQVIA
jgi:hypothetical protein